MTTHDFEKNGLPIFDLTGAVIILNSVVQPVDHIRNVVTITTVDGLPYYGASPPRATPKPTMPL